MQDKRERVRSAVTSGGPLLKRWQINAGRQISHESLTPAISEPGGVKAVEELWRGCVNRSVMNDSLGLRVEIINGKWPH